ncbi:MAG: hypothetical protein A4E19_06850 [Nitrospira sp. SG-bin1]|nr:MAG: hypothetical protein A4E19_06850 [Nitrospira sp. SG-bin1]
MNPINREIIDETTKKFADDPEVANRLLWWLRNGHSCERWFQFEWAYKLESVLKGQLPDTYSIGCERNGVDIVIYEKPFKFPLDQQNVSAGIEIKWCGNWSATSSVAETRKDLKKIQENIKYNYPALALSFWLFATPSENNDPFYSWIAKQIKKGKVNSETLKRNLTSLGPDIETGPYTIECPSDFGKLEMFCIGFYNDKAKAK